MLGFNGGRIGVANTVFTGTKSDDPDYSSVSLLLNGNGTNGSTTFTDSSSYGHTVTANGNAQISTAQSKFGGASMYFDGSGDYLSVPDDTSIHLGSDNFTFEFWTYLNSTNGHFINKRVSTSANVQYLYFTISGGALVLFATSNGSSWDIASNFNFGNTTLSTGQWYHIALVRNGTEIATYVNGIKSPNTITTSATIHTGSTNPLRIAGDVPYNNYLNGYIDDFRLTKGVARYTSNFTPPTAQLPGAETGTFASGLWTPSDHIKQIRNELWPGLVPSIVTDGLVLHLDAGDSASYPGSGTTWTDLSGNGNHGTINGATYDSANGGSLSFDGNDYVSSFSSQISGTGSKTVTVWFKVTTTSRRGLCGTRPNSAAQEGWIFTVNRSSPGNLSYIHTGVGVVETSAGISTNVWYCATVTYDSSSNVVVLYLNGNQLQQSSLGSINSSSFNGTIGAEGSGQYLFTGNIAQVTIYNRALTPSEITQNFDALKGRYGL